MQNVFIGIKITSHTVLLHRRQLSANEDCYTPLQADIMHVSPSVAFNSDVMIMFKVHKSMTSKYYYSIFFHIFPFISPLTHNHVSEKTSNKCLLRITEFTGWAFHQWGGPSTWAQGCDLEPSPWQSLSPPWLHLQGGSSGCIQGIPALCSL